ncbi:hypothetical protein FOCC_FOCC011760 [Frankliniella occidentalis]|nr:hypothetical protein FOCC_FOCC011760 [Frankliniella occidentalis]
MTGRFQAAATSASGPQVSSGPMKATAPRSRMTVMTRSASAASDESRRRSPASAGLLVPMSAARSRARPSRDMLCSARPRPALQAPLQRSQSPGYCKVTLPDAKGADDLTSLHWLHSINILPLPTPPSSPTAGEPEMESSPSAPERPDPLSECGRLHVIIPMSTVFKSQSRILTFRACAVCAAESLLPSVSPEHLERYRYDGSHKPPFSYAALICMALRSHRTKMTLSDIYSWIKDNFMSPGPRTSPARAAFGGWTLSDWRRAGARAGVGGGAHAQQSKSQSRGPQRESSREPNLSLLSIRRSAVAETTPEPTPTPTPPPSLEVPSSVFLLELEASPCPSSESGSCFELVELGGDSPGGSPLPCAMPLSAELSAALPGPPPSPTVSATATPAQYAGLDPLAPDPLLPVQDDDDLCSLLIPGGWDISQLDQLDFLLNSL